MTTRTRPSCRATPPDPLGPVRCASPRGGPFSRGRRPDWNGYRAKPLASTGVTVAGLAGGALAVLLAGGSLLVFRKRHYAQGSGRHTAVNAGK